MKTCYIFAAGDMGGVPPTVADGDIVIAVDAGLEYAQKIGIIPDVILGDFDSASSIPQGKNVIRFPVVKDDTDTMLAVKYGLDKGFESFVIYGGLGGERLDHTVANIQTLIFIAKQGCVGKLVGENEALTVVRNSSIDFGSNEKGKVSVFAVGGDACGVTEKGLQYEITDAVLTSDFPLGVSNSLVGKCAEISVRDGMLLIVHSAD